jgi:glycerol-3-phosphate dehydrogenase (NAD(P)+)
MHNLPIKQGVFLAIALSDNFDTIYLHTHTQKEVDTLQPKHPALSVNYASNIKLTFDLSHVQDSSTSPSTCTNNTKVVSHY